MDIMDMARDEICRDCKNLGVCQSGDEPDGCHELILAKAQELERADER